MRVFLIVIIAFLASVINGKFENNERVTINGERLCFGLTGEDEMPDTAKPILLKDLSANTPFSQQFFDQYNKYGLYTWNVSEIPHGCYVTLGEDLCAMVGGSYIDTYFNSQSTCGSWNHTGLKLGQYTYYHPFPTLNYFNLSSWSVETCPGYQNHATLVYDSKCHIAPPTSPSLSFQQ